MISLIVVGYYLVDLDIGRPDMVVQDQTDCTLQVDCIKRIKCSDITTHGLVSQERLSLRAGTSVFIDLFPIMPSGEW